MLRWNNLEQRIRSIGGIKTEDKFMEIFITIMLLLPIIALVTGQTNLSEELPGIFIWYLIFGSLYLLFF